MWEEYGFVGLFAVSFGAATIFAGQFRAGFRFNDGGRFWSRHLHLGRYCRQLAGRYDDLRFGTAGKTDWLSKYFKISSGRLEQIRGFAAGRGAVAAFFGFLPAVGDVIVFVLGLFKANLTVVAFSCSSENFCVIVCWPTVFYRESSGWVPGDFRLQKNGLSGSVAKMSGRLISFTGGGYE